jgi:hypothetical protein
MKTLSSIRGRLRFRLRSLGLAALVVGSAGLADVPTVYADAPSSEQVAALQKVFAPEEVRLYQEYKGRTPITTRRKAEAWLADHPDSLIAHYVLGAILRQAEGALGDAMRHLGEARRLYEKRWPVDETQPNAPWALHREMLFEIQQLAGELEKHEYRLSMIDYYNALYEPDLLGERAWPLMNLDRIDDAREAARSAQERGGVVQRSLGRNAACAIEGRHGDRQAWFTACLGAFEAAEIVARDDPPFASPEEASSLAVHAYNAALAARAILRPDEVERLAQAGARRLEYTAANPWGVLMRLYLDQGRGQEAGKALLEAERWRGRQPPALRDQIRADADALAATLLLLAGKADAGRGRIDRALLHPDRRGLTTASREETAGAHALLRRALRVAQDERRAEAEACGREDERSWWERGGSALEARFADAADRGTIERALEHPEATQRSFGFFLHGGLEPLPVWLVGDLVEIMGQGVARVALKQAREQGKMSGLEAYFDTIEFELQYREGNWREAWTFGELVVQRLPGAEVALRARVAALAGDAALRDGEDQRGLALLEAAMSEEPGTLRRLGLALPAKITDSSAGGSGAELVALLEDSPRFEASDVGFRLDVVSFTDGLSVCIDGPSGSRLGCYGALPVETTEEGSIDTIEQSAQRVCEGVHELAFALPLGLSGTEMGSLDGSSIISDESSRRRLQRTLDSFVRD